MSSPTSRIKTLVITVWSFLFFLDYFTLIQYFSGIACVNIFFHITSTAWKVSVSEFFWSVFSRIWTEYGEIRIFNPNMEKYGPEKLQIRTRFTQCSRALLQTSILSFFFGNFTNINWASSRKVPYLTVFCKRYFYVWLKSRREFWQAFNFDWRRFFDRFHFWAKIGLFKKFEL